MRGKDARLLRADVCAGEGNRQQTRHVPGAHPHELVYWLRGDFEQCAVTCDEGIALAEQLGSPPVQYASIKGLALTDLGRFDAAWTSFQQEVADEAHPFGRCMREFGVAVWLAALGALE